MMCYSNGIGLRNPKAIVGSLALHVKGAGAQSFAVPSIPDDREHKLQPWRHNTSDVAVETKVLVLRRLEDKK